MFENVWYKVQIGETISKNIEILESDIYFTKQINIGVLFVNLKFKLQEDSQKDTNTIENSQSDIQIPLPKLSQYNFAKCENIIIAHKDDDTTVNMEFDLIPGVLTLSAYPFVTGSVYDLNIQTMVRVLDNNANFINQ